MRDAEIDRLRRVITDALYELRKAGADDAVRRVERRLRLTLSVRRPRYPCLAELIRT